MKKRIFSLVLALCMVVSLMPAVAAAGYHDTDDHWAEEAIARWSEHGIVEGNDGWFSPDGVLNRGQLAAIIARLLKLPAAPDAGFGDTDGHWAEDVINRCFAAGIMKGDGVNANPDKPISREETMVMLGRALGIKPVENADLSHYDDDHAVSDWAEGYVAAMTGAGIINGIDGNLAPDAEIDRASTMTILDRAITTYVTEPGTTVESTGGIVVVAAEDVTVTGEAEAVVVTQGAAGGTTTLENVNVGTVTVQAEESAVVMGENSAAVEVAVTESASGAAVEVTKDATVGTVTTAAAESSVTVSGTVQTVETTEQATGAAVEVTKDATVENVTAGAAESTVTVSGTVTNVTVSDTATGATVEASKGAAIENVTTEAANTTVTGNGKVENVTTSGNNTTVETGGTKVEAAEGTTGTTAGDKVVEGGESATTTPTTPSTPSTPTVPEHICVVVSSVVTAPTCTERGYTTHTTCCGYSYVADYVDALDHAWGDWTANDDGTHTRVCGNDSAHTETEDCSYVEGGDVCECGFNRAAVAKIGDVYYKTLKAAIEAVQDDETILLIKDTDETDIVVSREICFFINNAGYSYTPGEITADVCLDRHVSGSPFEEYLAVFDFSTSHHVSKATPNNDGTHAGTCDCGESTVTNEACTFGDDNVCDICGFEPEAKAGDTYYATLAEALAVGGEIVVLKDVTLAETLAVTENKNVVLNLNGKTITADEETDFENVICVATEAVDPADPSNSDLTIFGGAIDASKARRAVLFVSDGTLTMTDVVVTGAADNAKLSRRAIEVYCGTGILTRVDITTDHGTGVNAYGDGASVVLNDCDITVNGMYSAPYNSVCFSVMGGAEMTVNSGNYIMNNDNVYSTGDTHGGWIGIVMNSGGSITVKDGTFTNNPTEGFKPEYERAILQAESTNGVTSTIAITGGTFTAQEDAIVGLAGGATASITGGTFNSDPSEYVAEGYEAFANEDGTWTVGEQVIDTEEELIAAIKKGQTTIELANGKYTMPDGSESVNLSGKTLTIIGTKDAVIDVSAVDARDQFVTGATLKFEGVTLNFGVENYMGFANTASLVYEDCAINGLQFLYGPSVEFINCDLASNGAEHCVWTYGAKKVSFTGCDFVYGDRGINCYSDNDVDGGKQTVNFTSCTFATENTASKGAVEINSCYFSVGIEVNLTGCTAPENGYMAYVSEWDNTKGEKTTVKVDGVEIEVPIATIEE